MLVQPGDLPSRRCIQGKKKPKYPFPAFFYAWKKYLGFACNASNAPLTRLTAKQ